jgi:hypothetical protein
LSYDYASDCWIWKRVPQPILSMLNGNVHVLGVLFGKCRV